MAHRVDLPRLFIVRALENAVASLKRSEKNNANPLIVEIIQKDIKTYTDAINTITEIK